MTDISAGSGLTFGVPGASGPSSVGGAPLQGQPSQPQAPAPQASAPPPPQTPASFIQQFGSGLTKLMGGGTAPNYKPAPPGSTPDEQAAFLTQQRIQRANSIATDPVAQFFDPEGVQKARDAVPQLTQQLQTMKQQQQQQRDIMSQARNFGVPASQINPNMTGDTIDNYLLEQYKQGDPNAFRALKARGKDEWLTDFAGQALQAHVDTLADAHTAITQLNAAAAKNSQVAYQAALKALNPKDRAALDTVMRQEGGLPGIPDSVQKWSATSQAHGAAFAQQRQFMDNKLRQLQNATNFDQPMPKDVAESIASGVTLGSTNEPAFGGNSAKVRSQDGQPGVVGPNGSVRTDKFGLSPSQGGWGATNPERLEKNDKTFAGDDVKGALNQYNIANKFKHEALNDENYKSSSGIAFVADAMGGAGRDVAEKSAAAGTIGLTKMQEQKGGGLEKIHNMIVNEVGELQNWASKGKKGDVPRLSPETIRGIKAVAQSNYDFAKEQASGRLSGAMRYAGQIGRPLDDIPLDKDLKSEVARYHEEGRIDAINGFNSYPSIVRGNQRVYFQQGSNVNGADPPRPPVSFQQPPIASAPAGASGNPPSAPPTAAASSGPAGGGPVTIAGQPVTPQLPEGVSPNYLPAMQRVETGNERDPWTAGTKGSSASGAFQMIDSTWMANRPPGATATRAKDATPAQQTAANDKLMATNAAALKNAGLPVNDTNLYIAHNLGTAGAPKLLRAPLDADARSVVGEAAARNNPLFFRGRPTVAQALQRYDSEMQGGGPTGGNRSLIQREAARGSGHAPIMSNEGGVEHEDDTFSAANQQRMTDAVVSNAPAIGGVVGNVAGAVAGGGVPGAVAGGIIGGAAGQSFQDWMKGAPPSIPKYAEAAGYGAVGGLVPEARPIMGAVARVAGSGAVSATVKAMEGGDAADITIAGAAGAAGGVLGEGIGQLIGRTVRGNAAKELGGAAEILADPHATSATRKQAMQVASHYDLTEHQLVSMRDAVQSGASRAQAALPGGAATDATASQRVAPAIQQEHNAATHGYNVRDDALAAVPTAPGVRTNAVAAATRAGMDADPTVMSAARRLDAITENKTGRNPLQQFEAIRNAVSGIKDSARKADGITKQGLDQAAQLGDRVKEVHLINTLGTSEGPRILNYSKKSDAMWRDLKTTVENSDMLKAIGQGDERTSLGTALLNVVKIGHAGEDAALKAVNSINRITENSPAPRQAVQELYMREAFKGAYAKPDIESAARELLYGKSSSVARSLLTPEQLGQVQYVADHAAEFATKRKGEAGFESALMAAEGAHVVGHALPGAGLASAAFNLVQLRGNVRMFLRSLPPNYRDLIGGGRGVPGAATAVTGRAAADAVSQ